MDSLACLFTACLALAVLIAFDMAALRYGVDSREHFYNLEEQRQQWPCLNSG